VEDPRLGEPANRTSLNCSTEATSERLAQAGLAEAESFRHAVCHDARKGRTVKVTSYDACPMPVEKMRGGPEGLGSCSQHEIEPSPCT
jgi:hypothetical protein